MGLAGEDDLDRSVGVPQQAREAVHVGEQAGALVRREPPGEPDRQDAGVEDRVDLGQHRRCLAVSRELAPQPAMDEDRELRF